MELERKYAEYAAEQAIELLNIDSPSGFTKKAATWVLDHQPRPAQGAYGTSQHR